MTLHIVTSTVRRYKPTARADLCSHRCLPACLSLFLPVSRSHTHTYTLTLSHTGVPNDAPVAKEVFMSSGETDTRDTNTPTKSRPHPKPLWRKGSARALDTQVDIVCE